MAARPLNTPLARPDDCARPRNSELSGCAPAQRRQTRTFDMSAAVTVVARAMVASHRLLSLNISHRGHQRVVEGQKGACARVSKLAGRA